MRSARLVGALHELDAIRIDQLLDGMKGRRWQRGGNRRALYASMATCAFAHSSSLKHSSGVLDDDTSK